jgi:hypothetical protein
LCDQPPIMLKLTGLCLLCVLSISTLNAQNSSIKGSITDTLNKQNLNRTVIALLKAKDSVLVKFTRSDVDGKFEIKNVPAGKFVLMITHPTYADYMDGIELSEAENKDLGQVRMTLKSKLLEEVVVRAQIAAIRMKGDTIEYKADSFKVREGASVEEMLRKLPGLQVDKDGNVTAQGEKIEKVLVDGEEFFGDDPTMATKNIQADAIDKVQVFDKKSDQAAFTGIDDGTKTKTLNLTLKEDKKKGYFGKIELGGGPSNRWNNSLMANSFKSKRKFSVYGIMSSTGKTGLDWSEREKYGAGSNMEYNSDGGYFMWNGNNDEFEDGNFNGRGIPTAWNLGVQYSKKYDADKQNINTSYRYGKINNSGGGNSISQSILPTNTFTNKESNNFYSSKQRHSLNGTYELQIDSFTSLKIVANGYKGDITSLNSYNSVSLDSAGNQVNNSNRITSSLGNNSSFNSNFLLRKRFKKPGRTISVSFDQKYTSNNSDGLLNAVNQFYEKTGLLVNTDSIDQKKLNDVENSGYYSRVAYTEPIVKNVFLEVSYGVRVSNSQSKKLSYDKSSEGKYEVLNTAFSNDYDFHVLTNSGGMTWRYNGKKITFSAGGDVAKANFKQTDLLRDTAIKYNYTNFFPRSMFQYKFNSNSRVSLNYNGVTRQPSIEQIQPVRDNTNTLNIAVGNPDLKQEFRHSFNANFNSYKVLSQRGFYTYGSMNFVSDAITTNETTATSGDSIGKRTYQFINMNGNYSGNSGGGYNMKIKKIDISFQLGFNLSVSRNNSIVNRQKNVTDNNSYGLNFSVYKYKEKAFDINYYSDIRYNTSVSSIQPDRKTNFYTQSHNIYFNYNLPWKFEINTNVEANFRQRINAFDQNNDVVVWNGYIGRKLFKNDKGLIRLQAFDILDQNRGYNRFTNSSIIREETYQSLRRYFLLSFVLNFSKNPGGNAGN